MRNFAFILIVFSNCIYAQNSYLHYQNDIGIHNNVYNYKTIKNSQGFWSDNYKQNLIDQLNDENNISFEANFMLKYVSKKEMSIALKHSLFAKTSYNKDLFKLALFGNKPLAGEELYLSPFSLDYFRFSEIEAGFKLFKNIKLTSSFIIGHDFAKFNSDKTRFLTSINQEFIDYEVDLNGYYTNFNNNNYFKPNGLGGSFGFYYEKEKNGNYLLLAAKDVGFIIWNKNLNHLNVDTTDVFEGLEINNILNIDNENINNQIDRIETSFKNSQEKYLWRIPITLSLFYYKKLNEKYINGISLNIKHKIEFFDSPYLSINLHKNINKNKWTLGYHVGGLENPGFQFSYHRKMKKIEIGLFTNQANLFLSEEIYGLHIGLSIKKLFFKKNE